MKNFGTYLLVMTLQAIIVGGVVYWLSKSSGDKQPQEKVSLAKETKFRTDVDGIDTIYHTFKRVALTNDQAAIAEVEAKLKDKIIAMQEFYGGSSLPAQLALKLLNNYKQLFLLNQRMIGQRAQSKDEINRIKENITALEKSNQDMKTTNLMLQQTLLSKPQPTPTK